MEEKKATPYRRVGIRLFNATTTRGWTCPAEHPKSGRKKSHSEQHRLSFYCELKLSIAHCIEQPNSNPTVRSGFFFFHRGPAGKDPKANLRGLTQTHSQLS